MSTPASPPIIFAVTGASGAIYALRTARALLAAGRRIELIVSPTGRTVLADELGGPSGAGRNMKAMLEESLGRPISDVELIEYGHTELSAPPSSGSHRCHAEGAASPDPGAAGVPVDPDSPSEHGFCD